MILSPLTGVKECVNLVITNSAMINATKQGLLFKESAHNWSADEIQGLTEPKLIIAESLRES